MNNLETELWQKIESFNLDDPIGEYCFSLRLAKENYWTINYTQKAILEYKKFMFIAAVSEQQVSPSGVIDAVWHQHLIFCDSYTKFCNILNKQIFHQPSTGNKFEKKQFYEAKKYTHSAYLNFFGELPKDIWFAESMFDSLNLQKVKVHTRTFALITIACIIILLVFTFPEMRQIYHSIPNPNFIISYILIFICALIILEIFNRTKFKMLFKKINPESFIFDLHPTELAYSNKYDIEEPINIILNTMHLNEKMNTQFNKQLEFIDIESSSENMFEFQIKEIAKIENPVEYTKLIEGLKNKKAFSNIQNTMHALKKYIYKSKDFGIIYRINFVVYVFIILFGLGRINTGLENHKPIVLISITTIIFMCISIAYLINLSHYHFQDKLIAWYNNHKKEISKINWQWKYFLIGTVAFDVALRGLLNQHNYKKYNHAKSYGGGGDGGGCGSSCGSSCGGGCGGCGGCGG